MSNKNFKNQNRRNYNQYANKEETTPVEEIEESIDATETVEENEVVTEENEVVTEETEVIEDKTPDEVPKPVYGVVNCSKLNIRRGPSIDTASLCSVESGSKLDIEQNNEEWLKVLTEDGISGYCMRKFIDEQ